MDNDPPLDTARTTSAAPASTDTTKEMFLRLKEAVLQKRPVLREIIERWGKKTLIEYAQDYFSVNLNPPILSRQHELISTVHEMVQAQCGPDLAAIASKQLEKYYFVNTADHMGPITHPWALNTSLLIAAPCMAHQDPDLRAVITLACSNVSLNNASFPRGLTFHSAMNGNVKLHRLSFLPSNSHASAAYGFRPFTMVDIEKLRKLLRQLMRDAEIGAREESMIHDLLTDIYTRDDVLSAQSYPEQMIRTNHRLWQHYFPKDGKQHPDLIYLEQESLVINLLKKFHLYTDTTITHLLFDPEYDPLVQKYFDGILSAFDTKEQRGTYLFWGVSKDRNYRVQLWKKDNALVSADGAMRIELRPEALQAALDAKEIVPSIMLIFMVLSFYYGLKCLGGFNQVNYLTFMKNAYIKMQVDRGNYKSIEVCARAQTKETVDGVFAFLETPEKKLMQATGLDLILYGDDQRWHHLLAELEAMTVEDALNPGMADFYRFMYVGADADPTLLQITSDQISEVTGQTSRIRPFIRIHDYPLPSPV